MSKHSFKNKLKKKSTIILIANNLPCFFTLKKILETNCGVIGVVICEKKGIIYRLKKEFKEIFKYGILNRLSQILLSLYFIIFKSNSENNFVKKCFNNFDNNELFSLLRSRKIATLYISDYQSNKVINFIQNKNPDFIVSHTPYWISRKIRELSKEKIVIGSHPGIVPYYRGAHSSFWSKYDQENDKNGYSIFCLNSGVDAGPLIKQEKIPYNEDISYRCNDYYIMKQCSNEHAKIAENYSNGEQPKLIEQINLNNSQVKKAPGIFDYIRFKLNK